MCQRAARGLIKPRRTANISYMSCTCNYTFLVQSLKSDVYTVYAAKRRQYTQERLATRVHKANGSYRLDRRAARDEIEQPMHSPTPSTLLLLHALHALPLREIGKFERFYDGRKVEFFPRLHSRERI